MPIIVGGVFEVDAEDKPTLHQGEGLGNGYIEKMVNTNTAGADLAFTVVDRGGDYGEKRSGGERS